MGTGRRKIQMELAFMSEGRGEAPRAGNKGTEVSMAKRSFEDLPEPTESQQALKKQLDKLDKDINQTNNK